ncbi:hypothetical protein [Nostoc sp.]|uniref:hypothetical protein n=1 Tax=Nostoc sp. TaxID=1180 RepID=UPI002FFB18DA
MKFPPYRVGKWVRFRVGFFRSIPKCDVYDGLRLRNFSAIAIFPTARSLSLQP